MGVGDSMKNRMTTLMNSCFEDFSTPSSREGGNLFDDNPLQFKLEGIYEQIWTVTKNPDDTISIDHNYFGIEDGYTELTIEEF